MGTSDSKLTTLCQSPLQGVATVASVDEAVNRYVLECVEGPHQASLAPSCLLRPGAGDKVWWVGNVSEGFFVTAVLERADAPAIVQLPNQTTLRADRGEIRFQAERLSWSARTLLMEADEAALQIGKVAAVTPNVSWTVGVLRLTADLVESFAERLIQFSRWSQRMVDGPDMVRSRQIDYRAEQVMQLQAENLIANAENLFKADGEQIHLG